MRFMLNGQFLFQGEQYWRVDDMDRMQEEDEAGTYNTLRHLSRFGIAINAHNVSPELARQMVDAINACCKSPATEAAQPQGAK